MKRLFTVLAMLTVLMAGFMSVCAADEDCAPKAAHSFSASHDHVTVSKTPAKEITQDHCGTFCHVASHTILQTLTDTHSVQTLGQGRIASSESALTLGLYTVLDQPPRA